MKPQTIRGSTYKMPVMVSRRVQYMKISNCEIEISQLQLGVRSVRCGVNDKNLCGFLIIIYTLHKQLHSSLSTLHTAIAFRNCLTNISYIIPQYSLILNCFIEK